MDDAQDEDDGDDIPWPSPEIKANYEAALGRFILAFNRLDNEVTDMIRTVLRCLKREDLIGPCTARDFSTKLLVFDLLKCSTEGSGIADILVAPMREVGGERNRLAHGHFDQNPFDGSYDIVGKNIRSFYSAEMLDRLTEKADACYHAVRLSFAQYDFREPP
jgi:hypothetical protein